MLWTDNECWCAKHNIQQDNKTVVQGSEYLCKKNFLLVHSFTQFNKNSPATCIKQFTGCLEKFLQNYNSPKEEINK